MKYPLFKSLFALGTIVLVCSCSDDKVSADNGGDVNFVPCEAAFHLPSERIVILQDYRVTDLNGNIIGTAVVNNPATPNIVLVISSNGETIVNQVDLNDNNKVKIIPGDAAQCTIKPNIPPADPSVTTCTPAWYLVADKPYLIYPDSTVTDVAGNQVGIIANIPTTSLVMVYDNTGATIIANVNLSAYPVIDGNGIRYKITDSVFHLKHATGDYLIYATGVVTDANGNTIGSADIANGTITLTNGVAPITTNFAALPILQPTSKCVDYVQPVVSSSSVTPPAPVSSSQVTPPASSAVAKSSSSVAKSSSSQKKSSSSQAKSSSSQAKSSSSVVTGGCPKIVEKNGGAKGSGFASRYWDCCMPSCAWNENSGGNPTKACDARGKNVIGNGSGSVCSGGQGATCTSQIPFTVEGCEEYGFAFAAVPAANGGQCGKCFQLTFTGEGHYNSTNANTKKLKTKNKKLIVMATKTGGDVQQGQFDVLIPGGGVGMFNGCSNMGWGGQGKQYGGLLSDCEESSNYKANTYAKCLTEKCEKAFSNDEESKKGCMFLVEWMESAGNPEHNYVEVECPDVLKQRYK